MPDLYVPGVRQDWAGRYGWQLDGGPRKFILHSTECDSAPGIVHTLAQCLDGWANPHVVWDPWSGDTAMTGRADWAGGALAAGNRDGSVVLQVEAVGRAGVVGKRPFADSPMLGWSKILAWADSWGIPRVFRAGLPLAYPASYGNNGNRSGELWRAMSGYFGHSQVPGNDHGDPGVVDLKRIFPTKTTTEDEVSVLPTITGADHTHPRSLALARGLVQAISPGVDISTDAKMLQAVEDIRGYFGITGDAKGRVGPNMWRALLALATGGGK